MEGWTTGRPHNAWRTQSPILAFLVFTICQVLASGFDFVSKTNGFFFLLLLRVPIVYSFIPWIWRVWTIRGGVWGSSLLGVQGVQCQEQARVSCIKGHHFSPCSVSPALTCSFYTSAHWFPFTFILFKFRKGTTMHIHLSEESVTDFLEIYSWVFAQFIFYGIFIYVEWDLNFVYLSRGISLKMILGPER